MADPHTEDLEDRLDDLEAALSALRDEIEPDGRNRPPGPRDVLRFADEYAIPAAVAAMEANVRALEFLQAGIRATDPSRASRSAGRSARDRAAEASRASIRRLDRALSELESALSGSGMPASPEVRELLAEVRRLNETVADRVAVEEGRTADDAVRIDVESELEAIREEVEADGVADDDADA